MMAGVAEMVARTVVAFTLPSIIGFTGIALADPAAWFAAAVPLGITYFKKNQYNFKRKTISCIEQKVFKLLETI